ncbi:hypothetical protein D3C75_1140660 [compost metagenome]
MVVLLGLLGIGDALLKGCDLSFAAFTTATDLGAAQCCICGTEYRLGFGQLAIEQVLRMEQVVDTTLRLLHSDLCSCQSGLFCDGHHLPPSRLRRRLSTARRLPLAR